MLGTTTAQVPPRRGANAPTIRGPWTPTTIAPAYTANAHSRSTTIAACRQRAAAIAAGSATGPAQPPASACTITYSTAAVATAIPRTPRWRPIATDIAGIRAAKTAADTTIAAAAAVAATATRTAVRARHNRRRWKQVGQRG